MGKEICAVHREEAFVFGDHSGCKPHSRLCWRRDHRVYLHRPFRQARRQQRSRRRVCGCAAGVYRPADGRLAGSRPHHRLRRRRGRRVSLRLPLKRRSTPTPTVLFAITWEVSCPSLPRCTPQEVIVQLSWFAFLPKPSFNVSTSSSSLNSSSFSAV